MTRARKAIDIEIMSSDKGSEDVVNARPFKGLAKDYEGGFLVGRDDEAGFAEGEGGYDGRECIWD